MFRRRGWLHFPSCPRVAAVPCLHIESAYDPLRRTERGSSSPNNNNSSSSITADISIRTECLSRVLGWSAQSASLAVRRSLASSGLIAHSSQLSQVSMARRTVMPLPNDQTNFSAYIEIDLPSESRIQAVNRSGLGAQEWVALEKVHGTNFAIYYINETTFHFAKRSGIMNEGENFFGYHLLIPQFQQQMRALCAAIKAKFNIPPEQKMHKLILHGELFGGKYKHPLVPKSTKWCTLPNGKKFPIAGVQIQREPFPQYSPELHFYAFDVKYSMSDSNTSEMPTSSEQQQQQQQQLSSDALEKLAEAGNDDDAVEEAMKLNAMFFNVKDDSLRLLTYDEFVDVASKVPDLLYAKALVRGTLDQCIAFDVENFHTPLPALLGLGNYPLEGNLAEGIVIRHVRRGDPQIERHNVATIIKLRCSSFMELKHPGKQKELKETFIDTVRAAAMERARLLQRRKKSSATRGPGGSKTRTTGVGTDEDDLVDTGITIIPDAMLPAMEAAANNLLLNNVSDGRLSNVLSKIGREPLLNGEMKAKDIALLLAKDALKDFLKDVEVELLNTPLAFRKMLIRNAYLESRRLVEDKWTQLLQEEQNMQAEQERAAAAV